MRPWVCAPDLNPRPDAQDRVAAGQLSIAGPDHILPQASLSGTPAPGQQHCPTGGRPLGTYASEAGRGAALEQSQLLDAGGCWVGTRARGVMSVHPAVSPPGAKHVHAPAERSQKTCRAPAAATEGTTFGRLCQGAAAAGQGDSWRPYTYLLWMQCASTALAAKPRSSECWDEAIPQLPGGDGEGVAGRLSSLWAHTSSLLLAQSWTAGCVL